MSVEVEIFCGLSQEEQKIALALYYASKPQPPPPPPPPPEPQAWELDVEGLAGWNARAAWADHKHRDRAVLRRLVHRLVVEDPALRGVLTHRLDDPRSVVFFRKGEQGGKSMLKAVAAWLAGLLHNHAAFISFRSGSGAKDDYGKFENSSVAALNARVDAILGELGLADDAEDRDPYRLHFCNLWKDRGIRNEEPLKKRWPMVYGRLGTPSNMERGASNELQRLGDAYGRLPDGRLKVLFIVDECHQRENEGTQIHRAMHAAIFPSAAGAGAARGLNDAVCGLLLVSATPAASAVGQFAALRALREVEFTVDVDYYGFAGIRGVQENRLMDIDWVAEKSRLRPMTEDDPIPGAADFMVPNLHACCVELLRAEVRRDGFSHTLLCQMSSGANVNIFRMTRFSVCVAEHAAPSKVVVAITYYAHMEGIGPQATFSTAARGLRARLREGLASVDPKAAAAIEVPDADDDAGDDHGLSTVMFPRNYKYGLILDAIAAACRLAGVRPADLKLVTCGGPMLKTGVTVKSQAHKMGLTALAAFGVTAQGVDRFNGADIQQKLSRVCGSREGDEFFAASGVARPRCVFPASLRPLMEGSIDFQAKLVSAVANGPGATLRERIQATDFTGYGDVPDNFRPFDRRATPEDLLADVRVNSRSAAEVAEAGGRAAWTPVPDDDDEAGPAVGLGPAENGLETVVRKFFAAGALPKYIQIAQVFLRRVDPWAPFLFASLREECDRLGLNKDAPFHYFNDREHHGWNRCISMVRVDKFYSRFAPEFEAIARACNLALAPPPPPPPPPATAAGSAVAVTSRAKPPPRLNRMVVPHTRSVKTIGELWKRERARGRAHALASARARRP